jgi:hypothetical protein
VFVTVSRKQIVIVLGTNGARVEEARQTQSRVCRHRAIALHDRADVCCRNSQSDRQRIVIGSLIAALSHCPAAMNAFFALDLAIFISEWGRRRSKHPPNRGDAAAHGFFLADPRFFIWEAHYSGARLLRHRMWRRVAERESPVHLSGGAKNEANAAKSAFSSPCVER